MELLRVLHGGIPCRLFQLVLLPGLLDDFRIPPMTICIQSSSGAGFRGMLPCFSGEFHAPCLDIRAGDIQECGLCT